MYFFHLFSVTRIIGQVAHVTLGCWDRKNNLVESLVLLSLLLVSLLRSIAFPFLSKSNMRCPSPTNSLRRSSSTSSTVTVSLASTVLAGLARLTMALRYFTASALWSLPSAVNFAAASAALRYASDKRINGMLASSTFSPCCG